MNHKQAVVCAAKHLGGWPDLAQALSLRKAVFPTAFVTCPKFKNKYGPGVIVGSEIHWRFKKGGGDKESRVLAINKF